MTRVLNLEVLRMNDTFVVNGSFDLFVLKLCMYLSKIGSFKNSCVINLVIGEPYRSDVSPEYAIRGNSVLFKCSIPPFVADFVSVVSWIDDVGNSYYSSDKNKDNYGTNSCKNYICVV